MLPGEKTASSQRTLLAATYTAKFLDFKKAVELIRGSFMQHQAQVATQTHACDDNALPDRPKRT
jgi:hypothetical protein